MRFANYSVVMAVLLFCLGVGCSNKEANNPSLKDNVKKSLEQADLKDVTVSEDRDKNLITLGGTVHSNDAKARAAEVAKQTAPSRVIANEVSIEPVGQEGKAKQISKDVDTAIEKEYHAVLVANHLDNQHIKFKSKNGVLTISGTVDTPDDRQTAQQLATSVPNVQQVINELEVKNGNGE